MPLNLLEILISQITKGTFMPFLLQTMVSSSVIIVPFSNLCQKTVTAQQTLHAVGCRNTNIGTMAGIIA